MNLFILAKLFYGSEVAVNAMQCFGSVRTATAVSVIAVHSAGSRHAGNNDGVPTAVISGVPRDEQIIVWLRFTPPNRSLFHLWPATAYRAGQTTMILFGFRL